MKISKLRADTAMRSVAGTEVPRQNTTSVAMRAALKKGGSNYAGESGEVDGEGAKSRLDRPGRKHGGACVERKAGGGMAGGNPTYADDKYDRDMDKDDGLKTTSARMDLLAPLVGVGAASAGRLGRMAAERLLPDVEARKSGGHVKKKK